jgi:S1-C subfamily serine protease
MLIGFAGTLCAAEPAPVPPDLTQGGKKDANHDWTLGPTGVRGWIFGSKGQTADARQILVTAVDTGSPADGVLRVNDVILGMDGKPFAGDARILLARALTAAEEKSGELRLIRWREGKCGTETCRVRQVQQYGAV